jgi:hypothetical protein
VSAVLRRPLRDVRPWMFGLRSECPEAFDETGGECVAHQLAVVLKRTLDIEGCDLDLESDEEIYPPSAEESPYEAESKKGRILCRGWREAGITQLA